MVWILLLCHFTADYPLQTDAMVKAKKHFSGLIAHVMVHFFTMLVVMAGLLQMKLPPVLPGILALTGLHFAIDTWKNSLSNRRPSWVVFCYLQDQALHIISILLVVFWMVPNADMFAGIPESFWTIPALGLVLVTHTWYITERVVTYKNPEYQQWIDAQAWPRMISRALMLTAWFMGWNLWALLVLVVGLLHHWLDLAGPFRRRALLIDISVVLSIAAGLSVIN